MCDCPFAEKLCPLWRQAVALQVGIVPETCLVAPLYAQGSVNPTSREEIPCPF